LAVSGGDSSGNAQTQRHHEEQGCNVWFWIASLRAAPFKEKKKSLGREEYAFASSSA